MNQNDTPADNQATEITPQTSLAVQQPAALARRATRLRLWQDAQALREDLGEGLSVTETCSKHGWSRPSYYRRARLAEKMARNEYNPRHARMLYLRREARYRQFQRSVEAYASVLEDRIIKALESNSNEILRDTSALITGMVKTMKFIVECEEHILSSAKNMQGVSAVEDYRAEENSRSLSGGIFDTPALPPASRDYLAGLKVIREKMYRKVSHNRPPKSPKPLSGKA
jgi:hypothetical protein